MPLKLKLGRRYGRYELSRDIYVVSIELVEPGRIMQCTLNTDSTGQDAMDYVAQRLELTQSIYFGFRYKCARTKTYRWIELDKPLRKQMDRYGGPRNALQFAVLYHTPDVGTLTDHVARYYYYLQMKQYITEGRLVVAPQSATFLASCSLQIEYGDHDDASHTVNYIQSTQSSQPILPKDLTSGRQVMEDLIRQVVVMHKELIGVSAAEAAAKYIGELLMNEAYGTEFFSARDEEQNCSTFIGYSLEGILVKRAQGAPHKYTWRDITGIGSHKRHFTVSLAEMSSVSFTMDDAESARYVAMLCGWQQRFHCTQHAAHLRTISQPPSHPLIKSEFSGSYMSVNRPPLLLPSFSASQGSTASPSSYSTSTLPSYYKKHTNSNQQQNQHQPLQSLNEYSQSIYSPTAGQPPPNSAYHSESFDWTQPTLNGRLSQSTPHIGAANFDLVQSAQGSTCTLTNQNQALTNQHQAAAAGSQQISGMVGPPSSDPPVATTPFVPVDRALLSAASPTRPGGGGGSGVKVLPPRYKPAPDYESALSKPTIEVGRTLSADYTGSTLERPLTPSTPGSTGMDGGSQGHPSSATAHPHHYHHPQLSTDLHTPNRMIESKFIKYRSTPDLALSALLASTPPPPVPPHQQSGPHSSTNDGPPLMTTSSDLPPGPTTTNGTSIESSATQKIGAKMQDSNSTLPTTEHSSTNTLTNGDDEARRDRAVSLPPDNTIQPLALSAGSRPQATANAYVATAQTPDLLLHHQHQHHNGVQPEGVEKDEAVTNDERLAALEARLRDNGASLTAEFDAVARQRLSAGRSTALKNENARKNRYSNVLPYEDTRVMLRPTKSNPHGYVNASNIQMPIGNQLLSYIAAQAPTKDTTADFWQMVWESGAQLIVMLTRCQETVKDQSRDLCHPYWPSAANGNKKLKAGDFQVSVQTAGREQAGRVISTLQLKNVCTGERRSVYHLQYLLWPTSSIPDNIDSLLGFLDEVNSVRRHLDNEAQQSQLVCAAAAAGTTGDQSASSLMSRSRSATCSNTRSLERNGLNTVMSRPEDRRYLAALNGSTSSANTSGVHTSSGRSTGSSNATTSSLSHSSSTGSKSWLAPTELPAHRAPTIVHCCSGAGRTGAYILIEIMIHCLEHNQHLEVSRALCLLRQQRMHLVQSATQYKFVYMCLIEYLRSSRLI